MKKIAIIIIGLFVTVTYAQHLPVIDAAEFVPYTYNAMQMANGDGSLTTKIHQKWINYHTGDRWEKIDLTPRKTGTGWIMDKAPYTVELPEYASDPAKFTATNKYDTQEKRVRNDESVTKIKQWVGAAHVKGKETEEGILYPGALPEGDILYQIHEQEWRSIVKMNTEPDGMGDVRIAFTETYSGNLRPRLNGKNITATEQDVGKGFSVSANEFRGIRTKTAYVWDSSDPQKRQAITIRGKYVAGVFMGTKIIPRSFLQNATYPVYTDTTSTFSPDPSPETSTFDGWVQAGDFATWDLAHDDTDGVPTATLNDSATTFRAGSQQNSGPIFYISRAFTLFDTSSIPDTDTITAATVKMTSSGKQDSDNDAQAYITFVGLANPASNTAIAADDYDQVGSINSPTKFTDDYDISSFTTNVEATWTVNATGLANISKTGITKWGYREGHDIEDVSVALTADNGSEARFYSSDEAGSTRDPVLTVTHSAAAVEETVTVISIY